MTTTLDPTEAYLSRCRPGAPDGLLDVVRAARVPGSTPHWTSGLIQRPLLQSRSAVEATCQDIAQLVDLLVDVESRVFGGPAAFLASQHVPDDVAEVIITGSTGGLAAHLRADVLVERGKRWVIEVNMGSGLGGVGFPKLCRHLLSNAAFAEFADEFALSYVDTTEVIARQLRRACRRRRGDAAPTIALVEERDSGGAARYAADDLTRTGLVQVRHAEIDDVEVPTTGSIRVAGQPVDVVFRYFFAEHITQRADDRATMAALVRAHIDERVVLFTGLDSDRYDSKSALAELWTARVQAALTPSERALVSRTVPWTRLVPPPAAADHDDVLAECVDRRVDLIAKPSIGFNSVGFVSGAQLPQDRWREHLAMNAGRVVVQRRIDPDTEVIVDPVTERSERWCVNFGYFQVDGRYAGTFPRARRADDVGPIGAAGSTTRAGCVFDYDTHTDTDTRPDPDYDTPDPANASSDL